MNSAIPDPRAPSDTPLEESDRFGDLKNQEDLRSEALKSALQDWLIGKPA